MFSGGLGLFLQVFSTLILARLLTPADFGVVTMVTTFSLLLLNFGINGFTEAVIQHEEINETLISNLFWIDLGIGLALTIAFAEAGTLLARFYHSPLVSRVTVGVSLSILMTAISVQHLALLKRAMRFSETAINEVISRAVSIVLSIVLAWMGWGYWALVAGIVAQPLVQSVGAFFLCPWMPTLPGRAPGTGAMVRFAFNVYGRFTINYCSRNTDNLLVGWRFGTNALGFYKKAYDLFALSAGQLTSPITNVAVAALSRFDPRSKQYRKYLLDAISVIAFAGMALSGEFALLGKDIIRLLLGPGWEPAGRIFVFFAPGIGPMLVYYVHGWIHLSIGKADRWLRWAVIEVGVTCLLFVLALPWGPVGVAVAWTLSFWLLTFPSLWYAGKPIDFRVGPVFSVIWKYVAACLLAGALMLGINWVMPSLSAPSSSVGQTLTRMIVVSCLFMAAYVAASVVLHRGFTPLLQVAAVLREMNLLHGLLEGPGTPISTSTGIAMKTEEVSPGPLVSILIPAYNAEEWVADCLRSAKAQTWRNKEIILVDDGSTDRTLSIARKFESDRIRIVTQKNAGAAAARNKALSLSRGDYIQWLDADDLLAPDKIARQMQSLGENASNRLLLSSPFGRFKYRWDHATFIPTALWCDLSPVDWLVRKLGQNVYMQTATWLVSRELTEAAGPWNTALLGDDDGEYFCRVLLASEGVRFVPEAKVYYRSPVVGTLSYIGRSDAKLEAHWRSMKLHISHIRRLEDSERVRNACVNYLQNCFIYFYPERPDIVKEAEEIAKELGGFLELPYLPRKYFWIRAVFGWVPAKRAQMFLLRLKWRSAKSWDKMLFRIGGRISAGQNVRSYGVDDV